ncbi:MAG: efflux RND transporter periplasmic adaptor subunit [Planctomycetaceae bacterium]|nr:efflux RND transporter periplasmic adaptor subunit [Planctomycetaceae bacterium]
MSVLVLAVRFQWLPFGHSAIDPSLTYQVAKRSITDTVIERGSIESQNNFVGTCQVPGWQNRIIFIVPEGSTVKAGEVVVRFDSAEVDRMISEKSAALNEAQGKFEQATADLDIQKNKSQSEVQAADLELKLAQLDRDKYIKGDFIAEKSELERLIADGQAQLEKVEDELRNMEQLVNKGFRTPEQLREIQLRRNSFRYALERDQQKMSVLVQFDFVRKQTEFDAKASEAVLKLKRAQDTATAEARKAESAIASAKNAVQIAEQELKELQQQKDHCEIKAPQEGTVAYANQSWFDPEDRIREGASVRNQQSVFYLPDMKRMQVKVQINEAVVDKIKPTQKAIIRMDAFPDIILQGTIHYVSELAQSGFSNVMNYESIIHIDSFPESLNIKPGMTAQVEIMVGVYENVLAVPVTAVTEHQGQAYVYRLQGRQSTRQRVKTGRTTHSFVELIEGVEPGYLLALDAYHRSLDDFRQADQASIASDSPEPRPDAVPTDM